MKVSTEKALIEDIMQLVKVLYKTKVRETTELDFLNSVTLDSVNLYVAIVNNLVVIRIVDFTKHEIKVRKND